MNKSKRTENIVAGTIVAVTALVLGVGLAAQMEDQAPEPASSLIVPAVAENPEDRPLPDCVTKDDFGPCSWVATDHGDGTGRSFTVLEGEPVYWDTLWPDCNGDAPVAPCLIHYASGEVTQMMPGGAEVTITTPATE